MAVVLGTGDVPEGLTLGGRAGLVLRGAPYKTQLRGSVSCLSDSDRSYCDQDLRANIILIRPVFSLNSKDHLELDPPHYWGILQAGLQ